MESALERALAFMSQELPETAITNIIVKSPQGAPLIDVDVGVSQDSYLQHDNCHDHPHDNCHYNCHDRQHDEMNESTCGFRTTSSTVFAIFCSAETCQYHHHLYDLGSLRFS